MREPNLIHGIDYLVDYYALLGIEKDAAAEDITKAYREQVRQWHPDVVARASPQLQREAQFKTEILTEAYAVLSNPEKRTAYDEKLQTFDGPISTSGNPVIDLKRRRIDIDAIVSGAGWEEKQQIMDYAKQVSGYDEALFAVVKKHYEANPDNDEESAYKSMLQKKLAFLSALESIAWEDAGVANQDEPKMVFFPDEHVTRREEQLRDIEAVVAAGIDKRVNALAAGEAPKLLTAGKEYTEVDAKADALALKQELAETAIRNLHSHRDEIIGAASERAKVLEELLRFTEWEYYPGEQVFNGLHDSLLILIAEKGAVKAGILYEMKEGVAVPSVQKLEKRLLGEMKCCRCFFEQFLDSGVSVAILYRNPELDILLEASYVMNEHVRRIKKP